jgi:uncharacterized membrane protein
MRFRFWLVIFLVLFLSGYFFEISTLVEMFPMTEKFGMVFSVLFFLPFWILVAKKFSMFMWKDFLAVGLVGLMSYGYELASINFGFPYGKFEYLDLMGGVKVLGDVPVVLPLIYVPMVLGMLYLFKEFDFWKKVFACGFGLMLFDICIDPGLTVSGIWEWGEAFLPGRLYDVPLQNFFGWFLTGSLSALVFERLRSDNFWSKFDFSNFWIWVSPLALSLVYWEGVLLREGYWVSVLVGVFIMLLIYKKYYEGLCVQAWSD